MNETRLISLCHDLYCFINMIAAKYTSEALENLEYFTQELQHIKKVKDVRL